MLEVELAELLAGGEGECANASIRERVERVTDIGTAQDGAVDAVAFGAKLLLRVVAQCMLEFNLILLDGEDAIAVILIIGVEGLVKFLLIDREGKRILPREEKDALIFRGCIGVGAVWQDQAIDFPWLRRVADVE